jgi:hypothetical protein
MKNKSPTQAQRLGMSPRKAMNASVMQPNVMNAAPFKKGGKVKKRANGGRFGDDEGAVRKLDKPIPPSAKANGGGVKKTDSAITNTRRNGGDVKKRASGGKVGNISDDGTKGDARSKGPKLGVDGATEPGPKVYLTPVPGLKKGSTKATLKTGGKVKGKMVRDTDDDGMKGGGGVKKRKC